MIAWKPLNRFQPINSWIEQLLVNHHHHHQQQPLFGVTNINKCRKAVAKVAAAIMMRDGTLLDVVRKIMSRKWCPIERASKRLPLFKLPSVSCFPDSTMLALFDRVANQSQVKAATTTTTTMSISTTTRDKQIPSSSRAPTQTQQLVELAANTRALRAKSQQTVASQSVSLATRQSGAKCQLR